MLCSRKDMLIQNRFPAFRLDLLLKEGLKVVVVLFLAEEFLKRGWICHGLHITLIHGELRPLHALIVVEGRLDLFRSGSQGVDGQQVMCNVVVEAVDVVVYVKAVVILLQELAANLAGLGGDFWDMVDACRGGAELNMRCCGHVSATYLSGLREA